MAQLSPQDRPRNAVSNSPSGDSYTGLGCFPLGRHITPSEVAEIIQSLRSLRENKLLHQAQVFWARHARDAIQSQAVHELLDLLEVQSEQLEIYVYPDSVQLSNAAPIILGPAELSVEDGKTYFCISDRQTDLAGTVMHTFLSSRRITRLQCFLAEYVLADQAGRLTEDWELPERLQDYLELLPREELQVLRERLDNEGRLEAPILLAKLAGLCEELLEKMPTPVGWTEEKD